jgi:hypothetical protein
VVRGDDAEFAERIKTETLEILHPEYKTEPRVFYK